MTENDLSNPETNPNPEILSERDKKLLLESGKRITERLLSDYPTTLPNVVIYPLAAAGPLADLFDPIFKQVATHRGVPEPQTCFFSLQGNKAELALAEIWKDSLPNEGSGYFGERLAAAKTTQKLHDTQAREILQTLQGEEGAPSIAIIDDYATEDTTTLQEIKRAFGDPNTRMYALLGQQEDRAGVAIGMIDPDPKEGRASKGFHYRSNRRALQDTQLSLQDPSATMETPLRSNMRELGKQIAENL